MALSLARRDAHNHWLTWNPWSFSNRSPSACSVCFYREDRMPFSLLKIGMSRRGLISLAGALAILATPLASISANAADDPLASWNEGATKKSIMDFVALVTKEGGADYVKPEERIATFDNDGTLWAEQPYYFQLAFALDRVKAMAPEHPEWKDMDPFKSVLAGDLKGVLAGGDKALMAIVAAT